MAKSPNALPPDQIDALLDKSFPLVVLYKPDDPSHSMLHYTDYGTPKLYAGLALLGVVLTVLYFALFYPTWRERRRPVW